MRYLVTGGAAAVIFAIPAFLAAVELPRTNERWTKTEFENFLIFSNAPDRQVRRVAEDLLRLRQTLAEVSKLETRSAVPTYVYAFRNEASFAPFREAAVGKNRKAVQGIFVENSDANRILLPADSGVDEVIYHELTHYFVRNTVVGVPHWLDEGLGEFYGTFSPGGGSNSVRVGLPNKVHLTFLQEKGLMPLSALLTFDPWKYKSSDPIMEQFYGESWLFAHYLLIGNPKRGAALGQFLSLLDQGEPVVEAFERAFGTTMQTVQGELNSYLQRGRYNATTYTLSQTGLANVPEPAQMARDEVLTVLGDLLLHTDPREGADVFLRQAVEINPRNAFALADLGVFQCAHDRCGEGEKLCMRAVDAAGNDHRPLVLYGAQRVAELQKRARDGEKVTSESIAFARDLANRAVRMAPNDPNAMAILGQTYSFPGEDPQIGMKALEKSFQFAPSRLDIAVDLVLLYEIAGRDNLARSIIARVVRPAGIDRFLNESQENLTFGEYVRGLNLLQSGAKAQAKDHLRHALESVTNPKLKHTIVTILATNAGD
ncbi:MAG TPA: hypothetical protein VER58_07340 [Thermoanaerobaculia bacterium]|nr:hypothetical protein [Thermoanaerobaculia bacterium]